jgi:hypothetical protein
LTAEKTEKPSGMPASNLTSKKTLETVKALSEAESDSFTKTYTTTALNMKELFHGRTNSDEY